MSARILLLLPTTSYRTDDFMAATEHVGIPIDVVVGSDRRNVLEAFADGGTLTLDFKRPARSLERIRAAGKAVTPPATRAGESAERVWIRPTLALGSVVVLIVLLTWGYRGVMAGRLPFVKRARHTALIQVVGRATLSPRQSVCLVRTGPRLVLVGLSNGSMSALDVIDDPELTARLCGEAAAGQPDSHSAQFQRCLEVEAGEYDRGGAPAEKSVAESGVDADAKIIQLKQKLAGTIERIRERVRRA